MVKSIKIEPQIASVSLFEWLNLCVQDPEHDKQTKT